MTQTSDTIPNFCWDRKLTENQILQQLQSLSGLQKTLFLAWIMREATFKDIKKNCKSKKLDPSWI